MINIYITLRTMMYTCIHAHLSPTRLPNIFILILNIYITFRAMIVTCVYASHCECCLQQLHTKQIHFHDEHFHYIQNYTHACMQIIVNAVSLHGRNALEFLDTSILIIIEGQFQRENNLYYTSYKTMNHQR